MCVLSLLGVQLAGLNAAVFGVFADPQPATAIAEAAAANATKESAFLI